MKQTYFNQDFFGFSEAHSHTASWEISQQGTQALKRFCFLMIVTCRETKEVNITWNKVTKTPKTTQGISKEMQTGAFSKGKKRCNTQFNKLCVSKF